MATCQRRNTRQRQVVLEQLRASHSHPTAGELYHQVREVMPRISLGTVYRNLDILQEAGLVTRLAGVEGSEARYDGHCEPHLHLQCRACGLVRDLAVGCASVAELVGKTIEGHHVTGYQVLLQGLCRECAASGHR